MTALPHNALGYSEITTPVGNNNMRAAKRTPSVAVGLLSVLKQLEICLRVRVFETFKQKYVTLYCFTVSSHPGQGWKKTRFIRKSFYVIGLSGFLVIKSGFSGFLGLLGF